MAVKSHTTSKCPWMHWSVLWQRWFQKGNVLSFYTSGQYSTVHLAHVVPTAGESVSLPGRDNHRLCLSIIIHNDSHITVFTDKQGTVHVHIWFKWLQLYQRVSPAAQGKLMILAVYQSPLVCLCWSWNFCSCAAWGRPLDLQCHPPINSMTWPWS